MLQVSREYWNQEEAFSTTKKRIIAGRETGNFFSPFQKDIKLKQNQTCHTFSNLLMGKLKHRGQRKVSLGKRRNRGSDIETGSPEYYL